MRLLVPFLSYFKLPRSRREKVALVDELLRFSVRLAVLLRWGPFACLRLLAWQASFAVFLLYVNYLQHWRVPPGRGETWNDPVFNSIYLDFALHDQHHQYPSRHIFAASAHHSRRPLSGFHIFNPLLFIAFLVSTAALRRAAPLAFGRVVTPPRDDEAGT